MAVTCYQQPQEEKVTNYRRGWESAATLQELFVWRAKYMLCCGCMILILLFLNTVIHIYVYTHAHTYINI